MWFFFPFPHSPPTPVQVYLDHIPCLLMKAPCKLEHVAGWGDTSGLLILEENILSFILQLCQPGSPQQAEDERGGEEVPVDVALKAQKSTRQLHAGPVVGLAWGLGLLFPTSPQETGWVCPLGKGSEGKYKQCFHQFLTNHDLFVTNDQAYSGCMLSYLVRWFFVSLLFVWEHPERTCSVSCSPLINMDGSSVYWVAGKQFQKSRMSCTCYLSLTSASPWLHSTSKAVVTAGEAASALVQKWAGKVRVSPSIL